MNSGKLNIAATQRSSGLVQGPKKGNTTLTAATQRADAPDSRYFVVGDFVVGDMLWRRSARRS